MAVLLLSVPFFIVHESVLWGGGVAIRGTGTVVARRATEPARRAHRFFPLAHLGSGEVPESGRSTSPRTVRTCSMRRISAPGASPLARAAHRAPLNAQSKKPYSREYY